MTSLFVKPPLGLLPVLLPVLQQHPRLSGCVGHWLFLEGGGPTVFDLSVGRNHATLAGSPSWTSGPHGIALALSGTAQYAEVPDAPWWNFSINDWTIACWVSLLNLTTNQQLVAKSDGGTQHQFGLEYDAANDATERIGVSYRTGGGSIVYLQSGANPITNSAWHLVGGARVGNSLTVTLDGVTLISGTTAGTHGTMSDATAPLRFGGRLGGTPNYLTGSLSEVRIYNRALSSRDWTSLFLAPQLEWEWALRTVLKRARMPRPQGLRVGSLAMQGAGR